MQPRALRRGLTSSRPTFTLPGCSARSLGLSGDRWLTGATLGAWWRWQGQRTNPVWGVAVKEAGPAGLITNTGPKSFSISLSWWREIICTPCFYFNSKHQPPVSSLGAQCSSLVGQKYCDCEQLGRDYCYGRVWAFETRPIRPPLPGVVSLVDMYINGTLPPSLTPDTHQFLILKSSINDRLWLCYSPKPGIFLFIEEYLHFTLVHSNPAHPLGCRPSSCEEMDRCQEISELL